MLNPDFSDMLSTLNAERVEYLIVGGYAVGAHGLPRATKDIDLWVRPTAENAERVFRALAKFGAPLRGLVAGDFATRGSVYQIGVPPNRIDILTTIDGVEFDDAWPGRKSVGFGEIQADVIGRAALLQNKRAAGRPQDLADVARLEKSPPEADDCPKRST